LDSASSHDDQWGADDVDAGADAEDEDRVVAIAYHWQDVAVVVVVVVVVEGVVGVVEAVEAKFHSSVSPHSISNHSPQQTFVELLISLRHSCGCHRLTLMCPHSGGCWLGLS